MAVGDVIEVGSTVRFHVRDAAAADHRPARRRLARFRTTHDVDAAGALLFSGNNRGEAMFASGRPRRAQRVGAGLGTRRVGRFLRQRRDRPGRWPQPPARLHRVDARARHSRRTAGVTPDPRPVLALDVGGTKLAAGLVSSDGEVLTDLRVPTPSFEAGEGDLLWATVRTLLEDARRDADSPASGSAAAARCPGPRARSRR